MKKQIALLATLIAASGFTAFGQDWIEITSFPNNSGPYDLTGANGGTALGQGANASGAFDVVWLWAPDSTADALTAVGTQFASNLSAASHQVATNGVSSVSTSGLSSLLSGGWNVVDDENANGGVATTGEAVTTTGTKSKITAYNGGASFQIANVSGSSGSTIQLIAIAVNSSAIVSGSLVVGDITDLGWSNPFLQAVGTSSGDPNDNGTENGSGGMNSFGVAPVPEPTTLALAGLGGLSMLFLRRRKA
jgi:hypothetical protein